MKKNCFPWTLLLCLLLVGEIGLNWFTYTKARQYYLQLNDIRLDPFGLRDYPSTPVEPSPHTTRFVFFGDSRAAQWPALDLPGVEFVNRGSGAQTSAQVAGRFEAHVAPLQPDIILLQVCINDLKTIPLFPRRQALIVADCKANIGRMVTQAQEIEAIVILTTIFPTKEPSLERSLFWSNAADEAILEVNEYIRSFQAESVVVWDTFEVLAGENGRTQPEYAADFLHLRSAGYTQLNQGLKSLLADLN